MANEIWIDGPVGSNEGEVSVAMIRAELATADQSEMLTVHVHSEGGSVYEGFAIYDALNAYKGPKRCVIESSAFSIASFIPMAFDDIEITPNGYMMMHNPYVQTTGDDEQLAKQSADLANLKQNMVDAYAARSGKSTEEITAILRNETFLSAKQALAAGFVTRITETPVIGRVFAKLTDMPHGVVAALFGAGSSGETIEPTKENSMSDSKPVAASLQEIKAAYPKAKADFVLACLEKSLPMASVAQAAVEEMMAENQALMAKVAAMEQEMAKYKAMEIEVTPSEEEVEPEMKAMETEEEMPMPAARRRGVAPVAVANHGAHKPSASVQWKTAVARKVSEGVPRAKAIKAIDDEMPGLRHQMIQEVNAG